MRFAVITPKESSSDMHLLACCSRWMEDLVESSFPASKPVFHQQAILTGQNISLLSIYSCATFLLAQKSFECLRSLGF